MSTAAYVPEYGDRVSVRRWVQTADGARSDESARTGVLVEVVASSDGYYLRLDDDGARIFTGYQFLGGGQDGRSPASLVTEVTRAEDGTRGTATELYRQQVTPDMAVVADGAAVVLEISDALAGHVVRRVTVTNLTEFWDILEAAGTANGAHQAEAERLRAVGLDEKRRSEGRLTRLEAVDDIAANGYSRSYGVRLTHDAKAGVVPDAEGPVQVTFLAGGYFTVIYNPTPRIPS